jgi:pilus assembly protein Flp/PilA
MLASKEIGLMPKTSNQNGVMIMNSILLKIYLKFQNLKNNEEGQDLVEYALVVALIAFGATAGMQSLASGINSAFSDVSSDLISSI